MPWKTDQEIIVYLSRGCIVVILDAPGFGANLDFLYISRKIIAHTLVHKAIAKLGLIFAYKMFAIYSFLAYLFNN